MTYAAMQTRIRDELKRGNLTSQIQNAIVSAIEFYQRKHFRFNIARTQTTLAAQVEYISLPSDFIEAMSMIIIDGTYRETLEERTYQWIDQESTTTAYYSKPTAFAVQANELRLYPIPSSAYVLEMTYVYALPIPTDTTDTASTYTNAWFEEAEELIRTHAKVDILENVIRGQESIQEAQILRAREAEVFMGLRREYKRSQSSGRINPH